MFDPNKPVDMNDPRVQEAIERISREAASPMVFDFAGSRNVIKEGGSDVAKDLMKTPGIDQSYVVGASTRAQEIGMSLLQTLEEQNNIHPITPSELAVSIQVLLLSLLGPKARATPVRIMMQALDITQGVMKSIFMMCLMKEAADLVAKLKPKDGDQGESTS